MATREQTYKAQLQELGIYDPAFDPLIKELAQKERQRRPRPRGRTPKRPSPTLRMSSGT